MRRLEGLLALALMLPVASVADSVQPPLVAAKRVVDPRLGTIRFLSGANLSADLERQPWFGDLQQVGPAGAVALAYLKSIRKELRLDDPERELREEIARIDPQGMSHVIFVQEFHGIAVFGGQVRVHLDRARHVTTVEASNIPTPRGTALEFRLAEPQAKERAAANVGASDCRDCTIRPIIWSGLTHAGPVLSHEVTVSKTLRERWRVIVDAGSGAILDRFPASASR